MLSRSPISLHVIAKSLRCALDNGHTSVLDTMIRVTNNLITDGKTNLELAGIYYYMIGRYIHSDHIEEYTDKIKIHGLFDILGSINSLEVAVVKGLIDAGNYDYVIGNWEDTLLTRVARSIFSPGYDFKYEVAKEFLNHYKNHPEDEENPFFGELLNLIRARYPKKVLKAQEYLRKEMSRFE